jgi:indolepyruvate ferredoxin oxidoreductase beta subunit
VIGSAAHHPVLALEVARCGRLIKGYGSTNERGQANLRHILAYVSAQATQDDSLAETVARMREAALQDEAGQALDQVLREHGAAPRPVPEQPIRFVRRPRSS